MSQKSFEPYRLGAITLANHIVMAPMTRSRALGGIPNEMMVTYYRQRAGAGLIVTEGTSPAPEGLGYPRIPGLYNREHVIGWRRVTDADETYAYLANELQAIGIVYVHLLDPARYGVDAARTLTTVRRQFSNTLVLNGGYHTLDAIEEVLTSRKADLVAAGRPFISNPDFVERLRAGIPLTDPNPATFYAPGPGGFAEGYTDYTSAA